MISNAALDRRHRRARRAVGVAVLFAAMTATRASSAATGPGCEAEAGACTDSDNDGFVACGCALSGAPCDCNDGDPSIFPGAPEACDAVGDKNCNGAVNETCGVAMGCTASLCVPVCVPLDDFGCPGGSHFERVDGGACLCAPDDCTTYGCAPGFTCDDAKRCVPNCNADVVCPFGQRCRGFGCVDPCAGIDCPEGAACVDGRCTASCACAGAAGCAATEACDPALDPPRCVEAACLGVSCPAGSHCEGGTCRDDCAGVVCPPERVCKVAPIDGGAARGQCLDLCANDSCTSAYICDWRTGGCLPRPTREGGLSPDDSDAEELLRVVGNGWTCGVGPMVGASASLGTIVGLALAMSIRMRRRRR